MDAYVLSSILHFVFFSRWSRGPTHPAALFSDYSDGTVGGFIKGCIDFLWHYRHIKSVGSSARELSLGDITRPESLLFPRDCHLFFKMAESLSYS